ncbi:MAG: von Willebrand factor type A domain-containing protein [Verrucomicrobiota bacterium]
MKKCKSFEKQLVAYIHGELNERKANALKAHLETCEACRAELEAQRATLDLLGEVLETTPAPVELKPWWRLSARLRPQRTFSDYWYSPQLRAVLLSGAAFCALFFISLGIGIFPVPKGGHEEMEVTFEKPKAVERPKMKLKKPRVKVRKSAKPKPTTRIVAKRSQVGMPEIRLPEMSSVKEGFADTSGGIGGFDMIPSVSETTVFGCASPMIDQEFNTEQYSRIVDNAFKPVLQNPLSTFSIDVDRAAYANVRRFLNDNMLPPPDAVRIEEMVNYFTYDYPQPKGLDPFTVSMELAECPWNGKHQLALIGLQGLEIETKDLPPNNLVFLLDVSGSMNSSDKLPLLKSAMRLLVGQLRPEDRVSIVVYAGAAGLVLEPTSDKSKILQAINRLNAGGSTAGGAGIELAYKTARQSFIKEGNNRVILATDGDFNIGVSSDGALVRMIEEKRESGVFLSVLGFGTGNYKDSKMEQLADKGNGNYAYIDDILEAKKVLVTEMGGTLVSIAKDVKIQVEFNPAAVKAYRLVGYENRILAAEDFDDDKKDAGELGAGHTVTALYELILTDSDEKIPMAEDLKYQRTKLLPSDELMTVKLRYKRPESDTSKLISHAVRARELQPMGNGGNIAFASAVAEFGMLLRGSEYKGTASYGEVIRRATASKGLDEEGYRAEFIRLVEKAQLLDSRNLK